MHHALVIQDVLCIGCHIDHDWLMLWELGFEVCFLPFEFFKLVLSHPLAGRIRIILGTLPAREAEELKVDALQKVKKTIFKKR